MADHKAEWEIELEKLTKPMPVEAKADRTLPTEKLLEILGDIEKAATRAKSYLATGMPAEMRVELDKLRALLKVLEKGPSTSVDVLVSLLKAGVSEKVLKEIYGATDEEIQKAKRLLEKIERSPPSKHSKPLVPAEEWRKMTNEEVLKSVEVATRVLRGRTLTKEEKKYAAELSKDLINLATGESSPSGFQLGSEDLSSENPSESPELEVLRETVSFSSIKELAKVGAI
jgi:hypothetical protein